MWLKWCVQRVVSKIKSSDKRLSCREPFLVGRIFRKKKNSNLFICIRYRRNVEIICLKSQLKSWYQSPAPWLPNPRPLSPCHASHCQDPGPLPTQNCPRQGKAAACVPLPQLRAPAPGEWGICPVPTPIPLQPPDPPHTPGSWIHAASGAMSHCLMGPASLLPSSLPPSPSPPPPSLTTQDALAGEPTTGASDSGALLLSLWGRSRSSPRDQERGRRTDGSRGERRDLETPAV